jgi:hypothetical protein
MMNWKGCVALEVLSIRLNDPVVAVHSVEIRGIVLQFVEEYEHSAPLVKIAGNDIQNLGCLLQRVFSGIETELFMNLHHFLERLTASEAAIPLMLDFSNCTIFHVVTHDSASLCFEQTASRYWLASFACLVAKNRSATPAVAISVFGLDDAGSQIGASLGVRLMLGRVSKPKG